MKKMIASNMDLIPFPSLLGDLVECSERADILFSTIFNKHNMDQPTFGQKAVGLGFNPSGDSEVAKVKQAYANIIDQLNELRSISPDPEVKRLASVAITEAQGAQMWAVKAITWSLT